MAEIHGAYSAESAQKYYTDSVSIKQLNVLVIDDFKFTADMLSMSLYNTRYQLIVTTCGQHGLEYLRSNHEKVDVVLLDLMLPDISGFEVLALIQQDDALKRIPVIIQTAATNLKNIKELRVVRCLEKPYSRHNLLQTLDEACLGKAN